MDLRSISISFFGAQAEKIIRTIITWAFVGGCVFLLLTLLYFGQKQWVSWRERSAQIALATLLKHTKTELKKENRDYARILKEIEQEYVRHKNSYLAPFFLNLKSNVLVKAGDFRQALDVIDDALLVASDPILFHVLKTKRALMYIDFSSSDQSEGIAELILLAEKEDNPIRDMAQFYLGRYYWIQGNAERAKAVWQPLIETQSEHRIAPSPFIFSVERVVPFRQ